MKRLGRNVVLYNPAKKKRCVVDYAETPVAGFYNQSQIMGLYPGEVYQSMVRGKGYQRSWVGDIPEKILVDQMHFPAAKVSKGFLEFVPQEQKKDLYSCILGLSNDGKLV